MSNLSAKETFSLVLGHDPKAGEVAALLSEVERDNLNPSALAHRLFMTKEGLEVQLSHAFANHLHCIHFARMLMARTLIPAGKTIIDLGGANSPLHTLGYPHPFKSLTVIDLPPNERHEMYSSIEVREEQIGQGKVATYFGDMTDLSAWKDKSVDLVWSGQSIEHVPEGAGIKMVSESYRVLRSGGWFCLDTPNGLITRIHAATAGKKVIHPEHYIEYEPGHLQEILRKAGFEIVDSLGIRRMPQTAATGQFDYSDFVLGEPITHDVANSYIQYVAARKP